MDSPSNSSGSRGFASPSAHSENERRGRDTRLVCRPLRGRQSPLRNERRQWENAVFSRKSGARKEQKPRKKSSEKPPKSPPAASGNTRLWRRVPNRWRNSSGGRRTFHQ